MLPASARRKYSTPEGRPTRLGSSGIGLALFVIKAALKAYLARIVVKMKSVIARSLLPLSLTRAEAARERIIALTLMHEYWRQASTPTTNQAFRLGIQPMSPL